MWTQTDSEQDLVLDSVPLFLILETVWFILCQMLSSLGLNYEADCKPPPRADSLTDPL